MPYLKVVQREYFNDLLKALSHVAIADGGELNFVLTEVLKQYLVTHPLKYETFNTVVGALESCKLELYRRKVAPYESTKIAENGDVYSDSSENYL